MFRLLPLFLLVLSASAETPLLLYNHQHCDGPCTLYSILVFRDGTVQLQGDQGPVPQGRFQSSLPADTIQAWDRLLDSADLFEKESNYTHIERNTRASYLEYFTEEGHSVRHRIVNVESPEIDALEPRLQALLESLNWNPRAKPAEDPPAQD